VRFPTARTGTLRATSNADLPARESARSQTRRGSTRTPSPHRIAVSVRHEAPGEQPQDWRQIGGSVSVPHLRRTPPAQRPCRVRGSLQRTTTPPQPPPPPASARPPRRGPLPGADQAPRCPRRPYQRIRTSRVDAQVKPRGRVLEPDRARRSPVSAAHSVAPRSEGLPASLGPVPRTAGGIPYVRAVTGSETPYRRDSNSSVIRTPWAIAFSDNS
jgi:hypothetical protein